jgi:hypothetical protein
MLEQVARHVSGCDACEILMSDIEAESAAVALAFETENFELVPTERLRTKIFTEIAEIESKSSWLQSAAAALGFSNGFKWSMPAMAAFAGLVLVAGVVGFVLMSKPQQDLRAASAAPPRPLGNSRAAAPIAQIPDEPAGNLNTPNAPVIRSNYTAPKAVYREAVYRETVNAPAPVRTEVQPLEDEERYLQTINTLERSVGGRKGVSYKPANMVSYERDLATVDDSIRKMQKMARKNPKDDASKQLLLASYQNKIDLLSAASEKTELMASMR